MFLLSFFIQLTVGQTWWLSSTALGVETTKHTKIYIFIHTASYTLTWIISNEEIVPSIFFDFGIKYNIWNQNFHFLSFYPLKLCEIHLKITPEKAAVRWSKGETVRGHRGRYGVVERVTITAVRPNLIRVIYRIRLTKRPNQLDIH